MATASACGFGTSFVVVAVAAAVLVAGAGAGVEAVACLASRAVAAAIDARAFVVAAAMPESYLEEASHGSTVLSSSAHPV